MILLTKKRRFLFAVAVLFAMFATGCGGGGGNTQNGNGDDTQPPGGNNPPQDHQTIKYRKVTIAGSSITHGGGWQNEGEEGYLGEHSYVGYVEDYLREEVADTLNPSELLQTPYVDNDPMSYKGQINIYPAGSTITGTLEASDEIAIAYAGSNVATTIEMDVDGQTYQYTIPAGVYSPVKKVFDDTDTDFYKAFRQTNEKAVKIWKLPKTQQHHFTLKVKTGELHLNFVTNYMFYMQNAGVSGFEAADFLSTERAHSTVQDIIDFNPDVFIFESCTNDAKTWRKELQLEQNPNVDAPSTNQWIVENPVNFTADGASVTLPFTVTVKKGDVVIMGDYQGDITNMAVGIVASNTTGRTIDLSKIVTYEGQNIQDRQYVPSYVSRQCRIKRISTWEDRVKEVIRRVKTGTGKSNMLVGIGTSGVPNYYNPASNDPYTNTPYTPRRLLGYREKGQIMAAENGWLFVDFFKNVLKDEPGVDTAPIWSMRDNTHPNPHGRVLFGQAVKAVLVGKMK